MPEYFFHIRLDIATRNNKRGITGDSTATKLFASPPQVESGLSERELRDISTVTSKRIAKDWRAGNVVIQSIDMVPSSSHASMSTSDPSSLNKQFATSTGTASTKARFEPSNVYDNEVGYGVVRLYRDKRETPGLEDTHYSSRSTRVHTPHPETGTNSSYVPLVPTLKEDDCTTLGILAVPSYFSVTRFLSWVGDKTREEVTHFRMLRTDESSKYMVLMRFRNGKLAKQWKRDWNGTCFDDASPEIAQVVFIKSIELMPDEDSSAGDSYPSMSGNPLTSSTGPKLTPLPAALGSKPPAPPTPSLIEMPTCPVCLERMDESNGLITILCQHVFHCSCLYKWRGTGCPVCRFTHSGLSGKPLQTGSDEDNVSGLNECNICHSDANLWICLICGNIGCGRYDAAHAFLHWQQSGHAFSMDMSTQRIWDYEGDAYVHRIVQNKLDGKISEAPAEAGSSADAADGTLYNDYVPREKSDAMGREYTALLTSQLESQRAYFEEKISLVADKASEASSTAVKATQAASKATAELSKLREERNLLAEQTIPNLEKERDRASKRAEKAQEMARRLEKEWREEKTISEGLHNRIKKLDEQVAQLKLDNVKAKEEAADQADMVRDLQFFISGQAKLKEMGEEVEEGVISLPEEQQKKAGTKRARKGKGKAKEEG